MATDEKPATEAAAAASKPAAAAKPEPKEKPAEKPAEEARRVVPLSVTRWQLGEFMNARHSVSPSSGTPFEDVLRPEFWANIVRMAPGDIIEIRPEDQSYYAELYVLKRDRTSATVAVIRPPVPLEPAFKPLPGIINFRVEFAGSHGKWRVLRISDNVVMRDRFGTEGEARKWLAEYERMIAA
jgi:hypothetical protein